jgi:hypothetical protein
MRSRLTRLTNCLEICMLGLSSQVQERAEQACFALGRSQSVGCDEVGAVHSNRLGHWGQWPLP